MTGDNGTRSDVVDLKMANQRQQDTIRGEMSG